MGGVIRNLMHHASVRCAKDPLCDRHLTLRERQLKPVIGAIYNDGGINMYSVALLLVYFVLGAVTGAAITLSFCRPSWLYPKKLR